MRPNLNSCCFVFNDFGIFVSTTKLLDWLYVLYVGITESLAQIQVFQPNSWTESDNSGWSINADIEGIP